MVYVKRVELSHFKSFGGTTKIPLLPGFTVVSGPNGSGKSNILDALLFCLGLATSRGMRAERLPDLVNHNQNNNRSKETIVSVSFDIADVMPNNGHSANGNSNGHQTNSEWTVTRRLRVGKEGNYSSTYYINGQTCTATELHDELNRLRIYPEGYNVVLQGDVTRIITMNSRERREIIDELAGVAEFDRKIEQARQTLESVREREERYRIIEQELINSRDRLAADRVKAEKYQKLKAQIQEKQQQEAILIWQALQQKVQQHQTEIAAGETEATQLAQHLNILEGQIKDATAELETLNSRVKAMGEDEQLAVASKLATQKAHRQQLWQCQQELQTSAEQNEAAIERTQQELEHYQQALTELEQQQATLEQKIPDLANRRDRARATLQTRREQADAIAAAADTWVQEQTALSRNIAALQKTLNPLRTEQAQLNERHRQLDQKLVEQTQLLHSTEQELAAKQADITRYSEQVKAFEQQVQTVTQKLTAAQGELTLQQDTQTRLLREQRDKQRQLDKLEATAQAQQEAQGTYATKVILQANLPGICGLVAQLGQVDPRYQLALETAAGGRLGYVVVEDDGVAAAGIELLKQKRAGRATFLPLNRIQPPRAHSVVMHYARGFIDLAVNLIDTPPRYRQIFAYIFGSTVVFQTLNDARPHLGKQRIVTLEGDLLESSGAMTGGSRPTRSSLHFGTATASESEEIERLRGRLAEIEQILVRSDRLVAQKTATVRQLTQELTEARQLGREQQLRLEGLNKENERLARQAQLHIQLEANTQERDHAQQRLHELTTQIPVIEAQLQSQQQQLAQLEATGTSSEWQQVQSLIKAQEAQLQEREAALRQVQEQSKDLLNQHQRLEEKIVESGQRLEEGRRQKAEGRRQKAEAEAELLRVDEQIAVTEVTLAQLAEKLGETKQERDRAEAGVRSLHNQQQQKSWQQQKLIEKQQERQASVQALQTELEKQAAELPVTPPPTPVTRHPTPDTPPPIPIQLEQLQKELHSAQKRLQAMEPVNMLALEEHERTQTRLDELSAKLATLEAERTELLLRVENFTTLRFRAFKEAFDVVNENFQSIFATLSDGDGYLHLDNAEDPFSGGLNLVAHPKGKPVQRLSSMSGGEKSLTALSFIFALQRYRPSPFYAFDEVDMFLDGANVERLAKMVKRQAQQAQFIVVSLRRPMIESAERTIGVTQARGAYTQVLGIKL